MTNLYAVILSLYMAAPALAQEVIPPRSPLSYSLREYGLILAIAMLGGFVRWYNAVRKGESAAYDLRTLVGELFTSAFIGILTFWACEAMSVQPLVTAAFAGMAGHLVSKKAGEFWINCRICLVRRIDMADEWMVRGLH